MNWTEPEQVVNQKPRTWKPRSLEDQNPTELAVNQIEPEQEPAVNWTELVVNES